MKRKALYNHKGVQIKSLIPNLDPDFFLPSGSSNVGAKDIADRPYQYHAWTNACGRTISTNISRLNKVVVNASNPEEYLIPHDVTNLFSSPNIYMKTSVTFWQAVVLSLLLPGGAGGTGGQVFLVGLKKNGDKVNFQRGEIPDTLYPYSGKYITVWKEREVFKGWKYEVNGKEVLKFDHEEIIRISFFNPYDWLAGMSYFTPAGIAFAQDVKASVYNNNFFDNDATVSGLLTSDQHLTDEQFRAYMKRWYSNYGGSGSGKTAILGAGLKYQQYGVQHSDMQFVEQKEKNLEEMLATHGLNKIAIGKYEGINYATIKEGRKMLWQDTYMPIDTQIIKSINDQWVRHIDGGRYLLKSDYSNVEALREDYKTRSESARVMVEGLSFPASLAARINDIPLTKENLEEYPWLNDKPEKQGFDTVETPPKAKAKSIIIGKDLESEQLEKFSDSYIEKVLDQGEKLFIKKIDRYFISQRNRMQDKVDLWLKHQEKITKVLNISPQMFLLDMRKENVSLNKIFTPLVVSQLESEKDELLEELGELIHWDVTNPLIDDYVQDRQANIKEINGTTEKLSIKKINEAIEIGVKENYTPQKMAKEIKAAIGNMGEIRRNHSKTIARTETGLIHSKARFDAFHVEGFDYHQWVTAKDDDVRRGTIQHPEFNHRSVHMKVVKIGELFPVVNLLHPLDPNGLPGNIINCRCVAVAYDK